MFALGSDTVWVVVGSPMTGWERGDKERKYGGVRRPIPAILYAGTIVTVVMDGLFIYFFIYLSKVGM